MEVSPSGYYAWKHRKPSQRRKEDAVLSKAILASHRASRGTYGSPRVLEDLKERGFKISRRRVARLMVKEGITGSPRKRFLCTTNSKHTDDVADNILERQFRVQAPNAVWATDITYLRTGEGWLYLAVVVDLFSRRIVGWKMANHMRTELVLSALDMALGRRLPPAGMLHHSDRGSQYASHDYRAVLGKHGITCSMSRKGNCWDNAVVESFFATLKKELIYRQSWATRKLTRKAVIGYIEVFYNNHRKHSTLGYLSPAACELNHHNQLARISLAA